MWLWQHSRTSVVRLLKAHDGPGNAKYRKPLIRVLIFFFNYLIFVSSVKYFYGLHPFSAFFVKKTTMANPISLKMNFLFTQSSPNPSLFFMWHSFITSEPSTLDCSSCGRPHQIIYSCGFLSLLLVSPWEVEHWQSTVIVQRGFSSYVALRICSCL